jgi:hypothetical protein
VKKTKMHIYPTKFASSTQKHKKVFETPNQPIKIKIISNKSYPMEFTGSTQNPKKIIRTRNLPIRTKIFPKKVCFSTLKKEMSQKFVWELPDEICRLNPKS